MTCLYEGQKFAWLFVALLAVIGSGCGDGDGAANAKDASVRPVLSSDAATTTTLPSCEGLAEGQVCGPNRHCVMDRCQINFCGDGIRAGEEQCDDGNQALDDACTPSCKFPAGTCGDGKVEGGEECDDGNKSDSDACTTTCLRQLCRNGVLDLNEECDDGNTDPRDGCNNSCHRVVCGDGVAEEQEECDDGNQNESDKCTRKCTAIMCGNLRIDPSEECDGKLKKAANGAPGGEPIEEGLNCSADCKKIEDDRCKKCEEKYCHTFASEFAYGIPDAPDIEDMIAGCYTVGYKDKGTVGRVTDAASVAKCSALVECARRNRCDVYDTWSAEAPTRDVKLKPDQSHPGTLEGCLCGEVEPGSGTWSYFFGCNEAPAGKCVQQVYAASNCTDSACVEGNLVIQGVASYYAHYLSMCHRIRCFEVCR